jgi:hypothetical protein
MTCYTKACCVCENGYGYLFLSWRLLLTCLERSSDVSWTERPTIGNCKTLYSGLYSQYAFDVHRVSEAGGFGRSSFTLGTVEQD